MTLDQFVVQYTGKSVLFNTAYPDLRGQCVQLICFYNTRVLEVPVMWADAVEWWDSFSLGDHFIKIPYPGSLPIYGDVVIFNADTPGSAGAGHIDICIQDGTEQTFIGFDSNWGSKTAQIVTHDYKYVKGFLRPRSSEMTADEQTFYDIGKKASQDNWSGQITGLMGQLKAQEAAVAVGVKAIKDKWQDQIVGLQQQLADAQNGVKPDPDGDKWRRFKKDLGL